MDWLRSDEQTALQKLYVALSESIDYYEYLLSHCPENIPARSLKTIIDERKVHQKRLAESIKDSGDLPSATDPDKEAIIEWYVSLQASLTDDSGEKTQQYLIHIEEKMIDLLASKESKELWVKHEYICKSIEQHLQWGKRCLELEISE